MANEIDQKDLIELAKSNHRALKDALKAAGWHCTLWHGEDVQSNLERGEDAVIIDNATADEIMGYIIENHDARVGINNDVIKTKALEWLAERAQN